MMPRTTVTVLTALAASKPFTFSEMKAAPAGSVFRPVNPEHEYEDWFVVAVRNADTDDNILMYVSPNGTFETVTDSPGAWDHYTFVKADSPIVVTFAN